MKNHKIFIALCSICLNATCYGMEQAPMPATSPSNPLLLYPYGDEFDCKISDHKMIAATILPFTKKHTFKKDEIGTIQIISYNTWARSTSNGFKIKEIDSDADTRIQKNIGRIDTSFNTNPDTIFAIQEWHYKDKKKLQQDMSLKKLDVLCAKTEGENFENCFVYNPKKFKLIQSSTNDIKFLNDLKLPSYKGKTGTEISFQMGRYLHAKFVHLVTGQAFDVVNVHLKTGSTPEDIEKALVDHIVNDCSKTDICLIVGDFNADLSDIKLENSTVLSSINGHLWAEGEEAKTKTTDAIVYRK